MRIKQHLIVLISCCLFIGSTVAAPNLPPVNDPATDASLPGKFIWFDLASPAINAQKSFYGAIFGWTYHPQAKTEDSYNVIFNGKKAIGGMFSFLPAGGEQDGATWLVLMSVENPDQTVELVKKHGGSVEVQASQVSRRGRHALLRDPAGAIFGVLRSESGDPVDKNVEIGDIMWVDLFARDVNAMVDFYKALAPYETRIETIADDEVRTLLSSQGRDRAGIVSVGEEANRSSWVPYIRVADVSATLEKVVDRGGFAIVPPDERLMDGNVAVFVDPNGAVTGIVKWDYEAEPLP